jgi:CRISPR system Cascade subunit CasB
MNDDWQSSFLQTLYGLAPPDDQTKQTWNRGALAELRRGLAVDLWRVLSRAGRVFAAVPDRALADAVVIAGLFATHPAVANHGNLGACFGRIRDESGSVEKRFVALLDADKEDLAEHLRHAISLLRAKDIPIDWARLLRDLRAWDYEARPVQKQWSRSFWAEDQPKQPETASTTVTVTVTE